MNQAVLTLLAALLGAAAALTGQALGPVIQSSRSHRLWVRDKRAELTESYAMLLAQASNDLSDLYYLELNFERNPGFDPDLQRRRRVEYEDRAEKLVREMRQLESRLGLYASDQLMANLHELPHVYYAARMADFDGSVYKTTREAMTEFGERLAGTVTLMRRELGVP